MATFEAELLYARYLASSLDVLMKAATGSTANDGHTMGSGVVPRTNNDPPL